jgi:hypothetical protein
MNDREIMESAIRHMGDTARPEDSRPFWVRLLASLKIKISGKPTKPQVEVTGHADF